jgi:hypothetical protein
MHKDGPSINAYSLGYPAGLAIQSLFAIPLWAGFWHQYIGYGGKSDILGVAIAGPGSLSPSGVAALGTGFWLILLGCWLGQGGYKVRL